MSTVLVTGASGFVGVHILAQLLAAGHAVRGTVRSREREPVVRDMLEVAGADPGAPLLLAADLARDDGWREATRGCDYVIHVASPIPSRAPTSEDEVIAPARDGALRVLRAAREAGVKRVVMTSSCGAVYYGHPPRDEQFDETSWTNLSDPKIGAYVKSKAIAERAAWDFVEAEGKGLELSVVNPSGVFGPALGPDYSPSLDLIKRLLRGMPGCPDLHFGVVDVRDVAALHLRAMVDPAAKGERFIAVSGAALSMMEIALELRVRLGGAAKEVPTRLVPDWAMHVIGLFNPEMRQLLPLLGKVRNATSAKAERLLGWHPRPAHDAIQATAESLLRLGLI